jgi:hypothetical protein
LASLTLITISSASAAPTKAMLLNPNPGNGNGHGYDLPKFGFSSFNVNGYGERITGVRWGGIAQRMGLESGDVILSLNGYPLNYHGAWKDALHQAVYHGNGHVNLRVRDVRTGNIAFRQTYVGDICGPIEHNNYNGPVTYKSKKYSGNQHNHDHVSGPEQIKQIVELFNKKSNP